MSKMTELEKERATERPVTTDWQELVAPVFRRRTTVAVVVAIGTAIAAVLAWLEPPLYQASAAILVRANRAEITVSPDAGTGAVVSRVGTEAINAQVELLQSPELLRQVLRKYVSEQDPEKLEASGGPLGWLTLPLRLPGMLYAKIHDIPPPDPVDKLVAAVQHNLDVRPAPRSNLIRITYTSEDPEWAARLVNELVDAHIARNTRLGGESEALKFYRQQRKILADKLAKARAALQAFREREGTALTLIDEEQLKQRIAELELAKMNAEAELAEAKARERFLREEAKNLPAGAGGAVGLEAAQMVQQRILELKMTRSELLSRYAPGSTKIREIDRQIRDLEALLAGEQSNGTEGEAGSIASPLGELGADIIKTRSDIAAAKARIAALTNELKAYHEKLAHIERISSEKERLENEVETTKAAYLNYTRKEEAARFSDELDKSRIVNLSVAERATVPSLPESSKRGLLVWFGFIASLLLGVGLAYVRDRLDPAVKSATEASRIAEAPVLAEIPS